MKVRMKRGLLRCRSHPFLAVYCHPEDGVDLAAAQDMAVKALDNIVRRDSFVMAYNDAFLILGVSLCACIAIVWLGNKVLGGAGAAEAAH